MYPVSHTHSSLKSFLLAVLDSTHRAEFNDTTYLQMKRCQTRVHYGEAFARFFSSRSDSPWLWRLFA